LLSIVMTRAASDLAQQLRDRLKDIDPKVVESAANWIVGPELLQNSKFARDDCAERLQDCVQSGRKVQYCLWSFVNCVIERNRPCSTRMWFIP